uniref:Chitin-binding type-2 domain-containing protein n=1 Tax=Daphnia galeata TaxID=27404 RepID=A0A8J2WJJ3_9CRUS|nr:unnamed protein product [Daphnia galeata]
MSDDLRKTNMDKTNFKPKCLVVSELRQRKFGKMKSPSIPLVFLLCAVLAAELPGSTGDPVGSCPEFDGEVPIYLSDSVSCEVFYECSNGMANQHLCPPNPAEGGAGATRLHFNKMLNVCDYPANAKCNL